VRQVRGEFAGGLNVLELNFPGRERSRSIEEKNDVGLADRLCQIRGPLLLYVATEGKLVAIVAASAAQDALRAAGSSARERCAYHRTGHRGASMYGGDVNSVWHHADRRYARGRPVAAHLLRGHACTRSASPLRCWTVDAEPRKRPGEKIIAVGLRIGISPASARMRLR
jgi:hypothetical protein